MLNPPFPLPLPFSPAAAHFFYKREEIKALVKGWREEAEELAVYEGYLCRRAELGKAAVSRKYAAERAVHDREAAAAGAAAAREVAAASTALATATTAKAKAAASKALRAATQALGGGGGGGRPFTPSPSLRAAQGAVTPFLSAYSRWLNDTAVASHQVWQARLAPPPAAYTAALDGRIAARLADTDARSSVVAATSGLAEAGAAIAAEVSRPWSLGGATGGPVGGWPAAAGAGAGAGGAGIYVGMMYQPQQQDALATNLDTLKLSHVCPSFTLAACMAEAEVELGKLLDALTKESLEVEDE